MDPQTKLAKLESDFEYIQKTLQEIRNDAKTTIQRREFEELKTKVNDLEKNQYNLAIKVGAFTAMIAVLAPLVVRMFLS